MRFPANKKAPAPVDRREELRKALAAAPTLRSACPDAAFVRVELEFQADSHLAHASQTLSLYPPAKAHFAYACPYGDCNGVYDLNEVVFSAVQAGKSKSRGTLTCSGHRARNGKSDESCDLALRYAITVHASS